MSFKTSEQIRTEFIQFFEEKDHLRVASAPVVPQDDPTLLFTNAGMNQFKPIFLGEQQGYKASDKVWDRVVDSQRCIRVSGKHNDLEEVGQDTYHHTLFEMLGNWSFGDYFKKEAIRWAWELLVEQWKMEPGRLYATVFEGDEKDGLPVDEESIELWESETGINPEHILKFGRKDNFWEMGETGPCGPCSEVHIDLRPDEERAKKDGALLVNKDDPRVMEIWNLVFIQFDRQPDSSLQKLPAQHVDTGMGFERVCAILQDERSNYDSDLFEPLLERIGELAGISYGNDEQKDIAMRVIADHIRAVSFSIADGASPGNDGRGYVIRRILRRAVRYGWDRLDLKEPFFHKLVSTLAQQFKDVFPVLIKQMDYVQNVVLTEEKSFLKTLGQGIELLDEIVKSEGKISGEQAFKLHDTYGFPIDLTQLIARERNVEVDERGFNERMEAQKEQARSAGKFGVDQSSVDKWITVKDVDDFEFVGYDQLSASTHIGALQKEADHPAVILEQTPFYAESGGQVADTGRLHNTDETLKVIDVQKSASGYIHYLDHLPKEPNGEWQAKVDAARRMEIQKHHTATHLLHAALREVLGDHVAQKGSLVDENHLRFDFSHFEPITDSQLIEVESIVNDRIQQNIVKDEKRDVPIDDAKKEGATMLFGEKYGERVRVISFDPEYSMELCGGTHVNATGKLGYFCITGESSAAAGVRRIEAKTGKSAEKYLRDERQLLDNIRSAMGQSNDLASDIRQLQSSRDKLEKQVEQLQYQQSADRLKELENEAVVLEDEMRFIYGEIPNGDMNLLKQLGYESLDRNDTQTITILGTASEETDKVFVMAAVTEDLIQQKNIKAGKLAGELGRMLGGGGGGQDELATAGGSGYKNFISVFSQLNDLIIEWI